MTNCAAHGSWPTLAIMLGASVWGVDLVSVADARRRSASPARRRAPLTSGAGLPVRAARASSAQSEPCAGTGCCRALALAAGITNLGFVWGSIHGQVMRVLLLFYLTPGVDRAVRAFHPA